MMPRQNKIKSQYLTEGNFLNYNILLSAPLQLDIIKPEVD